jgi:L-lactate dehydrogenase complex protein LldF
MGAVLTPQFIGIEQGHHLPSASSFCGRCEAVCPVRIPLPKMMRHWREQEFRKRLSPPTARYGTKLWAFAARRPALYHLGARLLVALLGLLASRRGRFRSLPLAGGWTGTRDMPAPAGQTFQALWRARSGHR